MKHFAELKDSRSFEDRDDLEKKRVEGTLWEKRWPYNRHLTLGGRHEIKKNIQEFSNLPRVIAKKFPRSYFKLLHRTR